MKSQIGVPRLSPLLGVVLLIMVEPFELVVRFLLSLKSIKENQPEELDLKED